MAITDGAGLPITACITSASPAEVTLVDETLDSGFLDARLNIIETFRQMGDHQHAAEQAEIAYAAAADHPAVLNALGNVRFDAALWADAMTFYRDAIARDPEFSDAHNNLGNALTRLGDLSGAVDAFNDALALRPDDPGILTNLGGAYQAAGDVEAALRHFDQALSRDKDHADAHWNRGLARLLTGDMEAGFADYEWRWKLPEFTPRHTGYPAWDGGEIAGKTLLVHSEQGYGDTIQFIRYAPVLKALGAKLLVETHKPLIELISNVDGVDQVVERGQNLPHFDVQAPIMSLPHLLKTPSCSPPYIFAPETTTFNFESGTNFKVGVVWAGRASHKNDANRTSALENFAELSKIADVKLYSLQVGERAEDLKTVPWGAEVKNLSPELKDFSVTADAINQLDLVISVDTAVLHLAGALNKPAWGLLPYAPDWRWLRDRNETPWYPSLTLFRQNQPGDWRGVFDAVRRRLENRA